MKLSSLDIRKQEFTRVVRGYDKEEVDAFLQLAANQWQEIIDDLRREEEKVKELNIKLEHYQKVEEALEEALKTARDGAKQTIANAEHKARIIIEEAEKRSVSITKEAESERVSIRKDATKYSVRQKEIVAKLRAFLMSELEILAQYESEAPVSYIKLRRAEIAEFVEESAYDESSDYSRDQRSSSTERDASNAAEEYAGDQDYDDESSDGAEEEYVQEVVAEQAPPKSMRRSEAAEVDRDEALDRPSKESPKGKSKEPEVSDEIEKIRRILEDLEK